MSKKSQPCYGCSQRKVGCHGDCDKPEYLAWREELEARKEAIRKRNHEHSLQMEHVDKFRTKFKRRHGIK